MPDNQPETTWKENIGLSNERTYARIYPTEDQKTTWKQEAEEQGFSSLSKYLITLIQDARINRQIGPKPGETTEEISSLKEDIDSLEDHLEQARKKNTGTRQVDDTDVIAEFLTDRPQTLTEILKDIVECGVLDEFVRKRVEDQLYFMAQHDQAIYDRQGGGWRLPRNQDGGETDV